MKFIIDNALSPFVSDGLYNENIPQRHKGMI